MSTASARLLRLLVLLYLFASFHSRAQSCFPPPNGLVAWWQASGNANDFFGANNGTLEGGAIATAPGEVGTAFQFDGTNGFVQVPNAPALEPTNLTIEAWVRFDSLNSSENSAPGQQYIVFKQNSRSGDFEGYDLGKIRSGTADHFYFQVASKAGVEVEVNSTTAISTEHWYHVAAVRGSNYIQLYVNGQSRPRPTSLSSKTTVTMPLYFGTSGESFWDGKLAGELDEVALYNRPLHPTRLKAFTLPAPSASARSPRCARRRPQAW